MMDERLMDQLALSLEDYSWRRDQLDLECHRRAITTGTLEGTLSISTMGLSRDRQFVAIVKAVSEVIAHRVRVSASQGGSTARMLEAFRLLPLNVSSDRLALITVRRAIDSLCLNDQGERPLRALVRSIGFDVECIMCAHQGATQGSASKVQRAWKPWPIDQVCTVGSFLAACLFETDRLCHPVQHKRRSKRHGHIEIAVKPDMARWLLSVQSRDSQPIAALMPA